MIKIKAEGAMITARVTGYEDDITDEAGMIIGAAVKILKDDLGKNKDFCRRFCEIALNHYFE